jgi:hypothetical protein
VSFYSGVILNDLPNEYLRLGESAGTVAIDQTANHYNGTISGTGVAYSQAGAISDDTDTALLLDGTAGYISLPSGPNPTGSAWSLEIWVRLSNTSFGGAVRVYSYGNPATNNTGIELIINAGGAGASFTVGNGTTHASATTSTAFAAGTYYLLCCVYNGASVHLYVNGVDQTSASLTGSIGNPSTTALIGRNSLASSGYLPGRVDEYNSFAYNITGTQIINHYNAALNLGLVLTDVGRNLLRDGLSGANHPLISYVALGTSNTTPTTADTKLGAEAYRKAVSTYTNESTGEVLINMYLAPSELVGTNIAEVGFFGGASAGIGSNTGVLLARGLYSKTKTNALSLTFVLDSSFS